MPCVPSSRANHTLLRSCCDDTGCGCETRSAFFADRFCPCNETQIDQPARQITVCDLLAPLGGRTFATSAAFFPALGLALAPICGSIDATVLADATTVATITDGVVSLGTTLAAGSYDLTVTGDDACTPASTITVVISA